MKEQMKAALEKAAIEWDKESPDDQFAIEIFDDGFKRGWKAALEALQAENAELKEDLQSFMSLENSINERGEGSTLADLTESNAAQAKRIAELEKENFALSAGQCIYKNGLVGDEYGNPVCTKNDALAKVQDALEKTLKHFTKTPSTLEDSNVRCFAHEVLAASKNGD